ncbi:NAD(P)-binding protein [Treponema denticola]|uniref:Amine oxidase domain-containing protein n=1 Tax=Treponema denticola SP33 TaxID=999437 RepID=M2BIL1_TREDN|nr:NAD(P)-binding protein [Treponema denticola]EMB21829.1 hypothetical protein HMPREF9733_02166 [Treponema denticola SP33]EPF36050.1 hypothetical protein HMPREF9732_02284 [Treponema denticola SP32]UTD12627.1 NAD(P)-binding protein [Treponema denticola]
MEAYKNVILGAGFAGIGAAYAAFLNNDFDTVVFEQDKTWGGLCGSFEKYDFIFDKAVHLSFSEIKMVQDIFYKIPHIEHKPEAKNYTDGFWVRHPIQNNCFALPVEERIKIIKSFINRSEKKRNPKNYRDYLVAQFGEYFAQKYPEQYTKKYWAAKPEQLNCAWCGNRLYIPTLDEVLRGAFTDKTPNTYYAKEMRYPEKGAYKTFLANIVDSLDIQYRKKAIKINTDLKHIEFSDGSLCAYQNLISTIPLPELCFMCDSVSDSIKKTASNLQASSICLVSIGFNKIVDIPALWFYVYDEDIPFARAHSPSIKSLANVPNGASSLQCEIYYSKNMPLRYSDKELINKTVQSLANMKIAKERDILFTDLRHIKYANVIFYHNIEKYRKLCYEYILSKGIRTAGRFGNWDYLWSDQSFMSGYNISKELYVQCISS